MLETHVPAFPAPISMAALGKRREAAMRWYVSIGTALLGGALVGGDVTSLAAPISGMRVADERSTAEQVDVELVLATDVSYSMDLDELAVQREGYADAIVSSEF